MFNFKGMLDGDVTDYADSAIEIRDWWIVRGLSRTPEFEPIARLWAEAQAELLARGLWATFRTERGMD